MKKTNRLKKDLAYMQKALGLARRGLKNCRPNPAVGALVIQKGRIIGSGYHRKAGGPHAETLAIQRAGKKAKGATLYVTLEPCSTWGKTPPCTDLILSSGIRRVVMALRDPNPQHNGRGVRILKKAGLQITEGVLKKEAQNLNETFFTFITKQRPFVLVKAAVSLDGRMATKTGDARWISEAPARKFAHQLRENADAVLVGVNTVIQDNPRLTVRMGLGKSSSRKEPYRIVLDSHLRIPLKSRLVNGRLSKKTIIATTPSASRKKARLLIGRGVKIVTVPQEKGRVSLNALLKILASLNMTQLLVEGGSQVITSFIEKRLADKCIVVIAPKLIGGKNAPTLINGRGIEKIAKATYLNRLSHRTLGKDRVLEGYPHYV